jgi:ABC-2 type transport system ATP-binding protein
VSRREFWKLLAEFLAEGLTIIMATPYLDEAERCTRVALISHGRLLAVDDPRRLQTAFAGAVLEVVASPIRAALDAARAHLGADRVQLFGDRLHVRVDDVSRGDSLNERLVAAGIDVVQIRRVVPSLEDVFIDMTSGVTPEVHLGSDSRGLRQGTP